jgi:hypothetical protein
VPKLSIHPQVFHSEEKPMILLGVTNDLTKEFSFVHTKVFTHENGLMNTAIVGNISHHMHHLHH